MNTLTAKWSNLTAEQRKQVYDFYQDDLKEKKIVLNQHSYRVNPKTGSVIFFKDF